MSAGLDVTVPVGRALNTITLLTHICIFLTSVVVVSAGQKGGKHARDGEGAQGSPSPQRSPKRSSKRGSKVSKSSSHDSTTHPDLPTYEEEPRRSRQDIQRDLQLEMEKEKPKKSPTKSPTKSPSKKAKEDPRSSTSPKKAKSPKKSASQSRVQEEPMTVEQHAVVESQAPPPSQQTPVKIENRELEPLTPLIINDVSVNDHNPQATSTPAANGVVSTGAQPSSPPLSKWLCDCVFMFFH